jgi:hypothetical protein
MDDDKLSKAISEINCDTIKKISSVLISQEKAQFGKAYICQSSDPFYWRKKANEYNERIGLKPKFNLDLNSQNYERSRIGQYYHDYGMDVSPTSEQYKAIEEVMNYIKEDNNSLRNIKKLCYKQQELLEKRKMLIKHSDDLEEGRDLIRFHGHNYKLRDKYRESYSMDTVEELYIKALAVSILAESNGKSDIAKDILYNGGMDVIKNIQTESVNDLLLDLQIIAFQGGKNSNFNSNDEFSR